MPAWDVRLPDIVPRQGYSEGFADTVLRSSMDSGPTKRRRRFTNAPKALTVPMVMSEEQLDIFSTWFEDEIGGGALSFTYNHPRTGVATTVAFTKSPDPAEPYGIDSFSMTLNMEIIP